jgi:hypothetical protein
LTRLANTGQHQAGLNQYRKIDGRWQFIPATERRKAKTGKGVAANGAPSGLWRANSLLEGMPDA